MRLIVVSDPHLRLTDSLGVIKDGLNSRLNDRFISLETAVSHAIVTKADIFYIGGDIFDKINPGEKLRKLFVQRIVLPLLGNNIHLIILMGNHDTNYDIVSFETEAALIEGLTKNKISFITTPTILGLEIPSYFIPYGFPIPQDNEGCPLLFGHHGIAGAETGVGVIQRQGEECKLEDFNAFKYSILGHYHKPQTLTTSSGGTVIYTGSTNVWDMSERLDKKRFLDLELKGTEVKIKSILLPERKFVQFEIHEGETFESAEDIKDAVVKLVFSGSKIWLQTLDLQAIKKNYEGLAPHKILISQKVEESKREVVMEVTENESEEQIIKRYCEQKKIDKDLTEFGITIFNQV